MSCLFRLAMCCVLVLTVSGPAGAAPDFPRRQVTVIVPYLPGGMVEMFARPITDVMSRELGVPVVVTPTPGAGGSIGNTKALRAKPDGYTILLTSSVSFTFHPLTKNVKYTADSAVPLLGVAKNTGLIIASPRQDNFRTYEEFINYCKAHPKEITVGVTGLTSVHKTVTSIIKKNTGCQLQLVPYDGALGVTNAVVSGHLQAGLSEYTQNPELLPMVYFTSKNDFFPDVRDLSDVGMPDAVTDSVFAFYAPAGTPDDICRKLADAIAKGVEDPKAVDIMKSYSVAPWPGSREELLKLQDEQREIVKGLIASGDIVPEK